MLTDHSRIKLEINKNKNNNKTNRKSPKVLKVSSIPLYNPWTKKIEMRRYFEVNDNKI